MIDWLWSLLVNGDYTHPTLSTLDALSAFLPANLALSVEEDSPLVGTLLTIHELLTMGI